MQSNLIFKQADKLLVADVAGQHGRVAVDTSKKFFGAFHVMKDVIVASHVELYPVE